MGTAEGNITTLGAGLVTVEGTATAALDLANKKSWILFFQKPLRTDISNNVYLILTPIILKLIQVVINYH